MKISPKFAGLLKGLLTVILFAVVGYLADAAHLTGILSPTLAAVVAGIFSALESDQKAKSGGTTALFGAVQVKRVV